MARTGERSDAPALADDLEPLAALIVDDDDDDAMLSVLALRDAGYAVDHRRVQTAPEMSTALDARAWDVVLCDHTMPQFSSTEALAVLGERQIDCPLIVVSGMIGEEEAVAAVRAGAADFVRKDHLGRLGATVRQHVEAARARRVHGEGERPLRDDEQVFRRAFDDAPVGIALIELGDGHPGRFLRVNRALCETLGRSPAELQATTVQALLDPRDREARRHELEQLYAGRGTPSRWEANVLDPDGGTVPCLFTAAVVGDPGRRDAYAIAQFVDLTERLAAEAELRYRADHDALTGVFNRRRFLEELRRTVLHAARYDRTGALLMLDIDNLKQVNDTLGHPAGDELITRFAETLRSRLRETDLVGRLGGDEFGVVLWETSPDEVEPLAAELLQTISRRGGGRFGQRPTLTASIGIVHFGGLPAPDEDELLGHADAALYAAKAAGRGRCMVWDTDGPRPPETEVQA